MEGKFKKEGMYICMADSSFYAVEANTTWQTNYAVII